MSRQIELGTDLWWDWHRIQVILKAATSSVREVGSPLLSQILMYMGMEGMLWGGADGKQEQENGPKKPPLGRRVWELRLVCQLCPAWLCK